MADDSDSSEDYYFTRRTPNVNFNPNPHLITVVKSDTGNYNKP